MCLPSITTPWLIVSEVQPGQDIPDAQLDHSLTKNLSTQQMKPQDHDTMSENNTHFTPFSGWGYTLQDINSTQITKPNMSGNNLPSNSEHIQAKVKEIKCSSYYITILGLK